MGEVEAMGEVARGRRGTRGASGDEGSSRKERRRRTNLNGSKERIKGKDKRKGSKTHTATHTRATVGPWASGVCEEGAGGDKNGLLFRLALRR